MKTKAIYSTLKKALAKLQESMDFPDTEPMRESTIQRYKYTFELSWKLMSSILKDQSVETYGIKNIIREAAKMKLIDNVEQWFDFALARNLASHIYKEEVADKVYKIAKGDFAEYVEKLLVDTKEYV